jgi:hypothetical protein
MVIDTIAGEGYGPLRGTPTLAELVPTTYLGTRAARLTLETGLTGQPDGQPLGDERCVYLGRDALRELIVAAALCLAEIDR